MVKAATLTSLYQTLPLSNLDLLSGRFPVTYLYLYPNLQNIHLPTILTSLRRSLAKTLHYYYPFSGRIVTNPATSEPEIICNNQGVLFVEASANVTLKRVNFYDLNKLVMQGKLVSLSPDIPFQVQVTGYTCGGVSMTFTFDHALGDAASFSKLLLSWSEISQHKPLSCVPQHNRRSLLRPRNPPTYTPSIDRTFVKCTIEDILNMPTPMGTMVKRLYHIDAGCINRLQQLASPNGKRTKVEALSAYIWKLMAKSIDGRKYKECKMGWLVDGRGRIGGRLKGNTMSNYIGNVLSVAIGEANVDELEGDSLAKVAGKVHEAISEATREEHFLEVMDWIECHRPGLMMARIVLGGGGGPAVVVSSGRRFPVGELEFGFGRAVLGTVSSTIDKIGVGYFNQRESGKNDGCWTVSAILWPQLVEALESDSVFHPISVAQHLLL
ncbi:Coniferyl alcohol acyltransferase [Linum grandiflorum]